MEPRDASEAAAVLAAVARAAQTAGERGGRLLAIRPAGPTTGPGAGQTFAEAKILFIRDGAWEVAWGRRRERLAAGDLLAVAPGTTHRERVPAGRAAVCNLFTAGDDLTATVADVVAPFAVHVRDEARLLGADGGLVRSLVCLLADEARPPALQRQARRLLLELLRLAADRPWRPQRGGDFLATACRRLIDERHADPACSAASLAAALGVHPGSLARAFRRATGGTVAAAQHLLLRERLPVAEVARRSGFTRRDVFTRAFRRAASCTPASWRRLGFVEDEVLRG